MVDDLSLSDLSRLSYPPTTFHKRPGRFDPDDLTTLRRVEAAPSGSGLSNPLGTVPPEISIPHTPGGPRHEVPRYASLCSGTNCAIMNAAGRTTGGASGALWPQPAPSGVDATPRRDSCPAGLSWTVLKAGRRARGGLPTPPGPEGSSGNRKALVCRSLRQAVYAMDAGESSSEPGARLFISRRFLPEAAAAGAAAGRPKGDCPAERRGYNCKQARTTGTIKRREIP